MTIQNFASFEAETAQPSATSKLVKAWEAKNAKRAVKASGVSLMALSLSACGSEDNTPFAQTDIDSAVAAANAAAATAQATAVAAEAAKVTVAETAKTAAEATATAATAAKVAAEADAATAQAAQALAEKAETAAMLAKVQAEAARNLALSEKAAAVEAKATALEAKAAADAALVIAQAEVKTAETALGVAQAAETAAKDAKTAADLAKIEAEAARDLAISEKAAAIEAKETAEAAVVVAEAALATQTTAITDAGFASLDALIAAYDALANPAAGDVDLTTSIKTYAGSDSDNIFSGAVIGASATGTTLNAGDVLNGGLGDDTLSVSFSGAADAAVVGVTMNSVETLSISNFSTSNAANTTFDATLATGLTTVSVVASSADGDTQVTALQNIVAAEMKNGTADLQLDYAASVVAGSSETQSLSLMNQTNGTFTSAGVETVNLSSTVANNTLLDLTTTSITNLNVSGDKNLTITNAVDFADAASATAVDGTVSAVGFTGNLNLTFAADVVDVTGGSGDDTFNFAGTLTTLDSVDGGDGVDTATMTGVADASTTALSTFGFSNVEKYSVAGAAEASITVSAASVTDLTHVVLVENADTLNDNGDTYSVTNLASGNTVTLQNSVDARDMNAVTVRLADASGASDSLTVELAGTSGHGAADNTVNDLNINDIETLNIVSGQSGTTALTATDDNTLDDLSADSTLTTLNISGSAEAAISVGTEATNLATVNAGTMTAALQLTMGATADNNITGGSAADTIIMAATLNNGDVVNGGDGLDTLTAISTGFTAATGALSVSAVETINLTNTGVAVIDAAGITGATEIATTGAGTSTTITNLAAGVAVGIGFNNTDGQANGLFDVALADATSTADALTFNINDTATGAETLELKATGIETITLDYTDVTDTDMAEYTIDVDSINSSTLVVKGGTADVTGTLTLTALDSDTTTLNAADYGGILTVATATATATNITVGGDRAHDITGSSAADVITMGETTGSAVTIDGGAGTDILNMTLGDGVQDFANISAIETINFTISSNADITTDAANTDLAGVDAASRVNFIGGNSLSSVTLGGATETVAGDGKAVNTILDFSNFNGNIADATFAADVFDNDTAGITVQVIGSAATTDTVSASYDAGTAGSAAVQLNMQGVEIFDVALADDNTELVFDMSLVTGLTEVNLTDTSAERADFNNLGSGTTIDVTATDGTIVEVRRADTSGTESQTIKAKAAVGGNDLNIVMADVETLVVKADSANIVDLNLSNMSMTAASATAAVNFTGANDINIIALNADITTINASGMTTGGAVVQTGRSSTAAADYVGSVGDDTFMMLNASDALDGSSGTGDTLDINFAGILGGIAVDLSSTTDQVSTMDSVTNTAIQKNFENVDVAGYTGFGASITGSAAANTIVGTGSVDSINGGDGNDVITGGLGGDVLTGGAGADNFVFTVAGQGSDTIKDFTTGSDNIDYNVAVLSTGGQTAIAFESAAAGTAIGATTTVFELTGTTTDGTAADLVTELGATATNAAIDSGDTILIANYLTAGGAQIWEFVDASGQDVDAGELTLLATLEGVAADALVTGDFI